MCAHDRTRPRGFQIVLPFNSVSRINEAYLFSTNFTCTVIKFLISGLITKMRNVESSKVSESSGKNTRQLNFDLKAYCSSFNEIIRDVAHYCSNNSTWMNEYGIRKKCITREMCYSSRISANCMTSFLLVN